jgi:hypothetical protein
MALASICPQAWNDRPSSDVKMGDPSLERIVTAPPPRRPSGPGSVAGAGLALRCSCRRRRAHRRNRRPAGRFRRTGRWVPRLRVLGNGDKPRVALVGPEVVATIDRYLESRVVRAGCHSPTDPLFVRRLKSEYVPFNRQAMDGLVGGWCRRRAAVHPPPGSLAYASRHLSDAAHGRRRLPPRSPAPPGPTCRPPRCT